MPGISDITGRLVYKERIESVTHGLVSDFREKSAIDAVIGLAQRFGRNNRALVRPFMGH